ncbi:MAG: hypothetical protein AAF483_26860 [Planctomycetota bacterium]
MSAIQRAIRAGLVNFSGDRSSFSDELKSRYDAICDSGAVSEAAAEEIYTLLHSQFWRIVSEDKLPM